MANQAQQIVEEGSVNLSAVSPQKPLSSVIDRFWLNSFCTVCSCAAAVLGPRSVPGLSFHTE